MGRSARLRLAGNRASTRRHDTKPSQGQSPPGVDAAEHRGRPRGLVVSGYHAVIADGVVPHV